MWKGYFSEAFDCDISFRSVSFLHGAEQRLIWNRSLKQIFPYGHKSLTCHPDTRVQSMHAKHYLATNKDISHHPLTPARCNHRCHNRTTHSQCRHYNPKESSPLTRPLYQHHLQHCEDFQSPCQSSLSQPSPSRPSSSTIHTPPSAPSPP